VNQDFNPVNEELLRFGRLCYLVEDDMDVYYDS
jgi:hypothetical protein